MTNASSRKMEIPFFRYPHVFAQQRKEILSAMVCVMEHGAYILQEDLAAFEAELAGFLGVGYAAGVANGTDALIIALRAAGVGPGDEVIVPSHTYVASAASVFFVGATPILVDCGPDHLVDPEAIDAAVGPRTKAVMPVHLNGRTCDMEAIGRIVRGEGLLLVEDAAQGLGSRYAGQCAGTFGVAAGLSFYPAKILGCFGDGGAVVASDPDVAKKVALLRDHGRDAQGEVVSWGLNSRLDNLQAAVLRVKLGALDAELERRRQIARLYRQGLEGLDDMLLPPGPDDDGAHFDVYQNYEVESGRRDALRVYLEQAGVRTIIQWGGKAVHQFPGLKLAGFDLPRTERLFQRCFLLPMNTSLTDDEALFIATTIRRFYGRHD